MVHWRCPFPMLEAISWAEQFRQLSKVAQAGATRELLQLISSNGARLYAHSHAF